jgi:transcriptional regulator with XRE-family HTH domain
VFQPNRRPITDDERPHLERLGQALRQLRRSSGLTVKELTVAAMISPQHWANLVGAKRRTKRSTLGRLVAIAVEANPALGSPDQLLEDLCDLAGPTLVLDDPGPPVAPGAPTEEDVRRLYFAWRRHERATQRARRRFDAIDSRYYRLTGEYAYMGPRQEKDDD